MSFGSVQFIGRVYCGKILQCSKVGHGDLTSVLSTQIVRHNVGMGIDIKKPETSCSYHKNPCEMLNEAQMLTGLSPILYTCQLGFSKPRSCWEETFFSDQCHSELNIHKVKKKKLKRNSLKVYD